MLHFHHYQGAQINLLPDDGVTVPPKHVGAVSMQILM